MACASEPVYKPRHIVIQLMDTGTDGSCGSPSDDSGDSPSDDTGEVVITDLPDWLEGSEVQVCESPLEDVVYEEVGEAMGLRGRLHEVTEHTESGALVVADLDQDGDLDVMIGHSFEKAMMFLREGDEFIQQSLPGDLDVVGLNVGDLDGDGSLEIAVAGSQAQVLSLGEDGWETEFLSEPIDDTMDAMTKRLIPGDIDNDGDLDLYAVRSEMLGEGLAGLDVVYINDGDAGFTIDYDQVPESERYRKGFDAKWFDVDGDGWQDIFVVNERFDPLEPSPGRDGTFLLHNREGQFERDDGSCHCELGVDGMGVDIADVDGDLLPDLYVAASMNNVLLQQWEESSYVDVTLMMNADPLSGTLLTMAWGSIFLDFDNDGLQDLLVAEGDLWHEFSFDPVIMDLPIDLLSLVETPTGRSYEDVSDLYGFGVLGSWRSLVAMDHNSDGVLDPIVTDVDNAPLLFMSQGCTVNGWLEVEAPMHSRVEVTAGGVTQVAWIDTQSSCAGSKHPRVHFGLGPIETVQSLVVTLPTGEELRTTGAFQARRILRVK